MLFPFLLLAVSQWWKGMSLTLQFSAIIPEKFMCLEAFVLVSGFSNGNAGSPQETQG